MSIRRAALLAPVIAAGACAAGIMLGLASGRSGLRDLALSASWGGCIALLLAAFLYVGDASPAFHGMRPDRANPSRFAMPSQIFRSRADVEQAYLENTTRSERVAGPGVVLAAGGVLATVASLLVYRVT